MFRRKRSGLFSEKFARTPRKQDVRCTFAEGEQTFLVFGVGMNRAHQFALGREGNFRDSGEACVERLSLQPGFAGRDNQRSFGGVALYRPPPVPLLEHGVRTVISFFVSVPVLSEAMTFAEPSVSTAARWRTMAFLFAMRCTPRERTAVTTAGKPSGTAATASATPRMSTSKIAEKLLTPWT